MDNLQDKNKEAQKSTKQLSSLFPNKVTVQIPQVIIVFGFHMMLLRLFEEKEVLTAAKIWQDEEMLEDWKQMLDRDAKTIKSQSNIARIRSVSLAGASPLQKYPPLDFVANCNIDIWTNFLYHFLA